MGVVLAAGVARADSDPGPGSETTVTEQGETVSQLGIGAKFRYVFVPESVMNLFFQHSVGMSSVGFGADFIRRKGNFDIDISFEYETITPNGCPTIADTTSSCLFVGKSDDPTLAGKYSLHFDNLALLGFDVSFIWHTKIIPHVFLRYGAGIGLGFVTGDIKKVECNAGSTNLDANTCTENPASFETVDKPPVVPIVNLLVGLRVNIVDKLTLNVEVGFRDMFYTGVGLGYFF
jgi:hypothetical protein